MPVIKNEMWYNRLLLSLILSIIFASCVCEPAVEDPSPKDLFQEYTENVTVDGVINPESEYIVVIGDIQEYITPIDYGIECYSYYLNTMGWIYTQQKAWSNIKCVLLTGDMTWENKASQWERYKVGASFFEDTLPLLICTGNHDYDWSWDDDEYWIIKDRNSSLLNSYFPGEAVKMHIINWFEDGKYENYITNVILKNNVLNIIVLEFAPREEVIEWANKVVSSSPDEKYILMTHEMIDGNSFSHFNSYARKHFEGTSTTYSTPQEIWDKLVYPNDNIICTLCGHNQYFRHIKIPNKTEREVSNIMFNLQYEPNGGNGKIMLWEFPSDKAVIKVSIYNTITRSIETENTSGFEINYK